MYVHALNRRGYIHERAGKPSQDSLYWIKQKGICAMCLCDGAGSYIHTEVGARMLSRVLSRWMCEKYHSLVRAENDRFIISEAVKVICECIKQLRQEYGVNDPNAFASTAICCAINAATGDYVALHIGDGLLAGFKNGHFAPLTPVEPGKNDYSDRSTLLSTEGMIRLTAGMRVSRGNADCIMMASDGAEGKLYSPKDNHVLSLGERLLDGMRRVGPQHAQKLLVQTANAGLKSLDDMSLGLMIRNQYPSPESFGWNRAESDALRRRRPLKAFDTYARLLDSGMSPQAAASNAHWGKNRKWKMKIAENELNVY